MLFRMTILAAAVIPLGSVAALAQSDPMKMLHLAAANQLGLIEYCQSHGWVDSATVDAQKKISAGLPPITDSSGISDAEDEGKQGTLAVNGNQMKLADAATSKGTTVQAICTQIGSTVKTAANNVQAMPTMPSGMPAMPSGMPAMPNGMPAMPNGMPAMPALLRPRRNNGERHPSESQRGCRYSAATRSSTIAVARCRSTDSRRDTPRSCIVTP